MAAAPPWPTSGAPCPGQVSGVQAPRRPCAPISQTRKTVTRARPRGAPCCSQGPPLTPGPPSPQPEGSLGGPCGGQAPVTRERSLQNRNPPSLPPPDMCLTEGPSARSWCLTGSGPQRTRRCARGTGLLSAGGHSPAPPSGSPDPGHRLGSLAAVAITLAMALQARCACGRLQRGRPRVHLGASQDGPATHLPQERRHQGDPSRLHSPHGCSRAQGRGGCGHGGTKAAVLTSSQLGWGSLGELSTWWEPVGPPLQGAVTAPPT